MNTINFENNSIGELIRLSGSGNASAFEKLSADVKPIILNAARIYRGRIPGYDMDDLIQEGYVLLWELVGVKRTAEKVNNFRAYFKVSVQHRFARIFQHYYWSSLIITPFKQQLSYRLVNEI